jgi:hypothetical protein
MFLTHSLLALTAAALASASPLPDSSVHADEHALFTAAGYQYPCAPNSTVSYCSKQISGTPMTAVDGKFFINPAAAPSKDPTVLYVDIWGQAFLVSLSRFLVLILSCLERFLHVLRSSNCGMRRGQDCGLSRTDIWSLVSLLLAHLCKRCLSLLENSYCELDR